jgi:Phage tail repeat like
MTWRDLGTFGLTNDWQFTPNITSSIVRITHLNVVNSLNIRGLIAQAISEDISFFDMRSFRQRTEKEVFLMLNFEGLLIKKLAIRRTDLTDVDWNIKIEELEGVSDINLPLGIADVSGLQAALTGKANSNHQHAITEVTGLEAELNAKAIASVVEAALLGKAPTNHQHQITEVTGLDTALSEKAIASEVNTALLGKAPTNHQHAIIDVTGLGQALSEKAIASEVNTALATKSPVGHGHGISDVSGLQDALDSKSDSADLSNLRDQLNEKVSTSYVFNALAGKSNIGHGHAISDVSGLQTALDAKAIASDTSTALAGKAATVHTHGISAVTGLQTELDKKAIASVVETALLGKAATNHQHIIADVTGLGTALSEKAIASEVNTALAGKANIGHTHQVSDVAGLIPTYVATSTPSLNDAPSGAVWHEITQTGTGNSQRYWRKQTWLKELISLSNASGPFWISQDEYKIDYFGPSAGIAGTASYHLPLDDRYNYLFKDFLVHCIYNAGSVDSTTNYWRALITTQPSGTTFANSGAIPNDNLSKLFAIDQIFIPAPGERLIFNPQKFGAAPNAKIAMSLTYHLVRK